MSESRYTKEQLEYLGSDYPNEWLSKKQINWKQFVFCSTVFAYE